MRRVTSLTAVACALVIACESYTDIPAPIRYDTALDGTRVKPGAVTSNATGAFNAAFSPTANAMDYTLAWTGLPGVVTGAHLHGPADANGVAGVLLDFADLPAGHSGTMGTAATDQATGHLDLSGAITPTVSGDSLKVLLNAGRVYVDVHTAANPNGEIRGQVTRTN